MTDHRPNNDNTRTLVVLTKGTMVNHYRVIEKIGAGGMGEVFLAEDTKLKRRVALKFMPTHLASDADMRARYTREAQAVAKLNHSNIVVIHEVSESGERPYFVMEHVEGQSLRDMMEGCNLSVDKIIELVIQICGGISAAHEKNVVHRDIKPSNIVIDAHGRPKVLDFGLATIQGSDQITKAGSTLGTARYMSPEQAQGRHVDDRTDVWSLGVVLYELLTGMPPFRADKEQAIVYHILHTPAKSVAMQNPSVSSDLDGLVMKMLEKEPALRPSSKEVVAVLSKIIDVPVTLYEDSSTSENVPTMVGREVQEGMMGDVFDTAAQGQARLLCITGEPGIGKTTLTEDFLFTLRSKKQLSLIAHGRCSERLAGTEAYLPLLEALESMMRNGIASQIGPIMKQLAPTWFFRIAPPQSGDATDSQLAEDARAASQERMKRELFAFLRELSRSTTVVFFFDDVHWADISTVDILSYLGTRGDDLKILTIVTYRPSELLLSEHPFIGVKQELQGRGICEEIALDFLGQDDIAQYLDIEFPGHSFPSNLIDFVHARTEGNPLFLSNVLSYLQNEGAIIDQKGWHLARSLSDIEEDIPQSIRSMIARKIDQLADTDRRLLMTAAVQGTEFHAAVVADAMDADEEDIEETLERLQQVHAFVRKVGEEELLDGSLTLRYGFVHALYQNSLYEALTPARRTKMSAAVATSLARHYQDDTTPVAGELGMLYESAREFAKASDSFVQAATKATKVYAVHEALELYTRATTCAKKLKDLEREQRLLAAEMGLANVYASMARFEDAVESCGRAESAADAAGMNEERINAICAKGMILFNLKKISEMRSEGERAMELARSIDSAIGMASAEMVLASTGLCLGELEEVKPLYEHAVPILKKAGLPEHVLVGLMLGGGRHAWRMENEEAHQILKITIDRGYELGSGFVLDGGLFFQAMVLGNQGRMGEAFNSLNEANRLAELNQDGYWLARLPNTFGWLYRELGDQQTSHDLNLGNVKLAGEFGMPEGAANAHINLGIDYLSFGELERAYEHLEAAQKIFAEDIWFRWRYNIRLQAAMAQYWIMKGDLAMARKYAVASEEAAQKHGSKKHQAWALKILGEISLLEDNVIGSQKYYENALSILTIDPCPTIAWKVLKAQGDLANILGDEVSSDDFRGRARTMVNSLADSVTEDKIRNIFLKSRAVKSI
jgi:serine/threonine protein kinase/tetratricopeptide (TPR) repeat protein